MKLLVILILQFSSHILESMPFFFLLGSQACLMAPEISVDSAPYGVNPAEPLGLGWQSHSWGFRCGGGEKPLALELIPAFIPPSLKCLQGAHPGGPLPASPPWLGGGLRAP